MKIGEVETDNLTDEQLRELAMSAPAPEAQPQPRDEQGRFAATDVEAGHPDEVVEELLEEQPAPVPEVFEETIDLGDGSGVQVFRGDSEKALRRKLVDAQIHASRKIREQNQRLKELEQAATPVLTADQRFVLQQRMMTEPEVVLRETVVSELEADRKRTQAAQQRAQEADAERDRTAKTWMTTNPDYYACEANGKKMIRYLKTQGYEVTPANLDLAYNEVKDFLQAKPVAAPVPQPQPQPQVRRSSGLSARRSAPPAPPTPPTTQDAYNMPIEKLRELANGGKSYGGW